MPLAPPTTTLSGAFALRAPARGLDVAIHRVGDRVVTLAACALVPQRGPRGRVTQSPTVAELDDDARQEREVRLTAERILATHLKPGIDPKRPAKTFWKDINLDLTSAALIELDLTDCQINAAGFANTTFAGDARFDGAAFAGAAWFHKATFAGDARFDGAAFADDARFNGTAFTGEAVFNEVTFADNVRFDGAAFAGAAWFYEADFAGDVRFDKAAFAGAAWFHKAAFAGNALFNVATFDTAACAREARVRVDPAKPAFERSSWPLGWTVGMPDVVPNAGEPMWVRLLPVPVVLSETAVGGRTPQE
ncbi:pentapeptide repeat-containing protein [Amycolatopsis vastitatis]|uniref:Pentapeptide repeat-containing protein n=1 Tax=Amycolatopsis vastitatis TaxID=1905142 RepID=A0A229TK29_9PSEU|nr:pentapeptide repeat-containing protein [Amycolatopsis vastitatis]OXM71059.1 hypothetical protein CF165_02525 [Amycolatopsis vastitatis]